MEQKITYLKYFVYVHSASFERKLQTRIRSPLLKKLSSYFHDFPSRKPLFKNFFHLQTNCFNYKCRKGQLFVHFDILYIRTHD